MMDHSGFEHNQQSIRWMKTLELHYPVGLVTFSPAMTEIQEFLFNRMYFHPDAAEANRESSQMMRQLFLHYIKRSETLERKARARLVSDGLWHTACDYVSGMTDRYALERVVNFGLGDNNRKS